MINLGLPEILMVGGVTLLVFGPKRLPELAKSLGKGIRDFKKALEGGGETESTSDGANTATDSSSTPQKAAAPRVLAAEGPTHARAPEEFLKQESLKPEPLKQEPLVKSPVEPSSELGKS